MQDISLGSRVVVLPEFRVSTTGSMYDGDECWIGSIEQFLEWRQRYLVRFVDGEYDYYYADQLRVLES